MLCGSVIPDPPVVLTQIVQIGLGVGVTIIRSYYPLIHVPCILLAYIAIGA